MYRTCTPWFLVWFVCPLAATNAEIIRDTIVFDEVQRRYILYLPDSYNESEKLPLVINLHGAGMTASQAMSWTGMNRVADANRFLVVYPQALGQPPMWNDRDWNSGTDDVGFIATLMDELQQSYSIDPLKVYATGLSQGGAMSYAVGAELSDRVAAIASVSGPNVFNPTAARPLPVLLMHGTADSIVPIEGGPIAGIGAEAPPIADVVAAWRESNRCQDSANSIDVPDTNIQDSSTVTRYEYSSCGGYVTSGGDTVGSELIYYEIENGGHTWPGGPPGIGAVNHDINASEEIWAFFSQHESPPIQSGDFNGDGELGVDDIDLLALETHVDLKRRVFDIDGNGAIDTDDYAVWVADLRGTWFGDANLDGEFNSADLVIVLAGGQYEDDVTHNSGWATGDWNADGEFNTTDLVVALADGGYEAGPRIAEVPEPSCCVLLLGALACGMRRGKRSRRVWKSTRRASPPRIQEATLISASLSADWARCQRKRPCG